MRNVLPDRKSVDSQVLKAMIDEKFKQVEDIYMSQGTESELKERIVRLEDENKNLQEYACKLEKAVKLLLDNQNNKKDKVTKGAQTEDIVSSQCIYPWDNFFIGYGLYLSLG